MEEKFLACTSLGQRNVLVFVITLISLSQACTNSKCEGI